MVSKSGKIISVKVKGGQGRLDYNKPREYKVKTDKDGYYEVLISDNNKRTYMRLHRLVWETFNGNIPDDLTIDHIDTNRKNNSLANLRLLTRSKNSSIGRANKEPAIKTFYELGGKIYSRIELQNKFNFNRKFWYKQKNKINDKDFKYKDKIFKRV